MVALVLLRILYMLTKVKPGRFVVLLQITMFTIVRASTAYLITVTAWHVNNPTIIADVIQSNNMVNVSRETVCPTCSGVVVFRSRTRLPSSEYSFIKCSSNLSIPRPSDVIRSPSVVNRLRNISVSYSRRGLAILMLDYNDDRAFEWWYIHSCMSAR